MKPIRWFIVWSLENLCHLLDRIPTYEDGRWYRYGDWGCLLGLSRRSSDLNDRWGLNVWKPVE